MTARVVMVCSFGQERVGDGQQWCGLAGGGTHGHHWLAVPPSDCHGGGGDRRASLPPYSAAIASSTGRCAARQAGRSDARMPPITPAAAISSSDVIGNV